MNTSTVNHTHELTEGDGISDIIAIDDTHYLLAAYRGLLKTTKDQLINHYLSVLVSLTNVGGEPTQARSSDVKVKFKVKAKVIEKSKYTRRLRACTRRHCILIYSTYT
jgi:hypothetical protein